VPLPYPHRATFLASALVVPLDQAAAQPYLARLLALTIFDHFLRHPVVTLGDEDERFGDDQGLLLDASHPEIEDHIDWLFHIGRRHEVLWFELSLDRTRPQATLLRSRLPTGAIDEWTSSADLPMAQQLGQCLEHWLTARRLPRIAPLPAFTVDDVREVGARLVKAAAMLSLRNDYSQLPPQLLAPLPRLAVPYLRVLAEVAGAAGRTLDPKILEIDPKHPVARRNAYVSGLIRGDTDRRAILPLVTEAPMYGKPHLSIWGEPFASDHPLENMGVRHQGIASSLMPANPYALHNYSFQLAELGRTEESYRWADRATVASPEFGAAHLDCVRRMRQIGRPGQAFAEAQYRCREILDRAAAGKLPPNEWQAPHHAALLIAFAHLDIGRIQEAIALADAAVARLPDDAQTKEAFAWAYKRLSHWKTDAGLLARAYAWEGYHRGDPGRAVAGLTRGRITDDEDAMMVIDSLVAIGREDQAEIAVHHCAGLDGTGQLGDGKARLAAARALILAGTLDEALDHIQIVQLRRSQSRLESDLHRTLRLAATRPAAEWERVVDRRLERGATTLAKLAARDLADFVPGLDTPVIRKALGDRAPITLDLKWFKELLAALPAAQPSAGAILARLAHPEDDSLAAADALAQEWWTALVPRAKDRDAHAAGAVLALGFALAQYLAEASVQPTPICGAYRHIATEALQLVRRSRYQIEPAAIRALLALIEKLATAPDWLFDTWLLRVERALDLEAEHGGYLDSMIAGLPNLQRYLRGDERIGWELRMAHDLAVDPSQYEPAAMLFERAVRAVEAGGPALAWSAAAANAPVAAAHLDVHWIAALANPTACTPWLHLARALFATNKPKEAFAAACHALTAATARERTAALADLQPAWKKAGLTTPFDGKAAFDAGLVATSQDRLELAIQHLRWAAATEPGNIQRAHGLAVALARSGAALEAVRVLAGHERADAPRLVGRMLVESGRFGEATSLLRYASRRFRSPDDFTLLAITAGRSGNDAVAIEAGKRALLLGSTDPDVLVALATGLYHLGEFVECEQIAQQLISGRAPRELRIFGLHAMARALAGQGRHVDAHPYAKEAARLGPNDELAQELLETMDRIVAQQEPPVRTSRERSMERSAFRDLEEGRFDSLGAAVTSPSLGITRAALAACEFRTDDDSGIPVAPRALDAAVTILDRTRGATTPDGVLVRLRALRIRDNAFIQIDPPPPLGVRFSAADFERAYVERDKRPHRPSALLSYAR
jgi:tetratricopeptide (TPR) repeat protein